MKIAYRLVLALVIIVVLNATASAQSWGFTLPGGAGFAYNSGAGGVAVSGGPYGAGVWAGGGPTVYYPQACSYRGPIYIPQGPGFGGYGPVPSAGYIRRGPISDFTSYWVVYPNVW